MQIVEKLILISFLRLENKLIGRWKIPRSLKISLQPFFVVLFLIFYDF